jgi:PAS domain S-box-containing protein
MKIRTQFFISLALFGVMLAIVAVSYFFTTSQTGRLEDQEQRAHNIAQAATELGYLANDYLLNREPQQRARWETRFDQVTADLDQIDISDPATATLVADIKANQRSLRTVFNDVATAIETNPMTDPTLRLAFTQVSWSLLQVPTQAIVFDAARLPEIFEDKADDARGRQSVLLISILGLVIGYFVINYGLVYRRMLHSLAEIQTGARFIGSGDLEYVIPAAYDDEVGDLARSFNKMTASLKNVTASKTDLEKENVKRATAEEETRIANEELRITNENLQENARKLELEMHERAASEERFRGLFQKAPYAVALSSIPDGRYADVNEAFLKMTGFFRHEVIGKNSAELNIFRDTEGRCVIDELQAKGLVQYAEVTIFDKNGNECIAATNIEKVTFNGRDFWLNMSVDITERKKAEKALAQSRERLELALAAADMGTFEWDIINDRRTWDDNTHRLLGVEPGTYDGTSESFLQVVHPADKDRVRANLAQAVETSVYNNEYRAVWSDGSVHHIAARGKVYYDGAGKPVRMAAICWEITEDKQAAEALRQSYAELERINRAAVSRELKMIELKKEINKYYNATGQPPRYMIDPNEEN